MNRQRMLWLAAFIVVAAIYVAARFWNLTASCLWFDEIFSVNAAEHSWDSILNFVAMDLIHPPLFYLVLKLWILIGGESLVWLRSLPMIFSMIAIIPFALLCRELRLNYWTWTLAFFLIAVNGSLIKYAQEVRMYSMLMCMSLFSMWLFSRYFQKGQGIVALTLVNIVLVYTHYFGWLVLVSEFTAILALQRIKWRAIISMAGVTAAAFTPWLVIVIYAANSGSQLSQNIGWMQRPGIVSIAQLALGVVEPFYYPATSIDPMSVYRVSIPLLLIAITAICVNFVKARDHESSGTEVPKLLTVFIVIPLLIAVVASWILPYSVWGTRHLIIVFAPAAILIANSIRTFTIKWFRIGSITLLFLFSLYAFVLAIQHPKTGYIWCAWDKLAVEWQSKPFIEPGSTKLYVFEDLVAYHFWFETRSNTNFKINKVNGFPGIVEDTAYFLPRGFDQITVSDQNDSFGERSFWIAFRDSDPRAASPGLSMIPYTSPTVNYFIDRGFAVQDVTKITVGGETAYLLKLALPVRIR